MNTQTNIVSGMMATFVSAVGTATQTNEILQTISLIITIVGAIISMVVIPILNWYMRAKKDGKITIEEVKEGVETLQDGIEGVGETIKKEEEKNGKENQ